MISKSFRLIVSAALLAAFSLLAPRTASALTVKDWEAQSRQQQSAYMGDFIEKFTAEIGKKDPAMCQAIRDWFVVKPAGWSTSEGAEKLEVEISVLDDWAKQGRTDLSKIQIEGVIVKVIKDKFQPKQQAAQK